MRLLLALLLALAVAAAGCTTFGAKDEPVKPASTPGTQPTTATSPSPSPSPPPSTTQPTPATTTSPTPPPPPAPSTPSDLHANKTGWANFTPTVPPGVPPAADFVAKLPFTVVAGAKNLSAQAIVSFESPGGESPLQTASFNLTVLAPDGKTLAWAEASLDKAGLEAAARNVTIPRENLTQVGEYVLRLTIHSAVSDGSSAGYKYDASVDVTYR